MSSNNRFYITTPIYYVNAKPHIGHTYSTVAADVLARWHRLIGDRTFFSTGTDEHGAKIEEKAREAGLAPAVFTDRIAAQFKEAWSTYSISYDRFIRTTEEPHQQAVQEAMKFMYKRGDIYVGTYAGLYCRGCEQFKTERELVDGKCPDHQTVPEELSEESYMFRLSKYREVLYSRIATGEFRIRPDERRNEILSLIEHEGLKDVSFSRKNVGWGVKVPWDEEHTIYVWADAFLNYLTALGWDGEAGQAPDFWPPDIQLMSKDILRVHATIWPAMLLALELPLPRELFVHGYFLSGGQKMSKSLGNVISPEQLRDRYGSDAARYLLLSSTGFGHDGDISFERMDEKYNSDLANGIGNLFARVASLCGKYYDGTVPARSDDTILHDEGGREQIKFRDAIAWTWDMLAADMAEARIDSALTTVMRLVGMCDKHISAIELWKFVKTSREEGAAHIYSLLETLRHVSAMLDPFIPGISARISRALGFPGAGPGARFEGASAWGGLEPGSRIEQGLILFARLEKPENRA